MKSERDGIMSVRFGNEGRTKKMRGLGRERNLLTLSNLIFLLSYVRIDIWRDDSLDGHF